MNDFDVEQRSRAEAEEMARKPKPHARAPGKPWEVDIDVYLDDVGPPPNCEAKFRLISCLPMDPYGNIIFYNCGRKGFTIRFNLFDNTGGNYVFPTPPGPNGQNDPQKWALWSKEGAGCPPDKYGAQWLDFQSDRVEQGGQVLVVNNANSKIAAFGYTLRVTNDKGTTFVNMDPGGTNMNGSTSVANN